jgi:hypothetical protein
MLAISARSERSYLNLVSLVAVAWLLLLPFFPRRIGGSGGGSEKAIVGVIWVVSAIAFGIYLYHDAHTSVAVG